MEGELREVLRTAADVAGAPEPGVLATVVRVRGSAPQVVGAKLVLRPDGRFVGTIGGGAVEAAVLADATRVRAARRPRLCAYDLAADLGMCCGGGMEVFVEPIVPDHADLFAELGRIEAEGGRGAFGVVVKSSTGGPALGAKAVASVEGYLAQGLGEGPLGEWMRRDLGSLLAGGGARIDSYIAPGGHEVDVFLEPLQEHPRLVIFGGGHVAKPLAHVGKLLGFRVVVVDERVEWASPERFPDADEIANEPVEDFLFRFEHRSSDYLVVVTRGHDLDQRVLEAVIGEEYRYLGMIGARAKVKRIFLRLEAAGVLGALLGKVRAPVGLNVGAETPEEIAVAIGAELVMERRGVSPREVPVAGWWRGDP